MRRASPQPISRQLDFQGAMSETLLVLPGTAARPPRVMATGSATVSAPGALVLPFSYKSCKTLASVGFFLWLFVADFCRVFWRLPSFHWAAPQRLLHR